jgi:hypothetical protein
MTLAMAHDYRVLKGGPGKASAMMCMNEVRRAPSVCAHA